MPSDESGRPKVGVVTVAYRSDRVLPGFFDSISASVNESIALVVADNCPADGDLARTLTAAQGGQYLPLPMNPGYGAAINAAVAALPASVEWVLVSNPDVLLEPGAISTLRESMRGDQRVAAVGPQIRNTDGSTYPSARALPSLRIGVGHALFGRTWPTNPWTTRYYDAAAISSERREVGWLSGSCILMRRTAFDEVGGFDVRYFMYFEDVDLGYRLAKAGYASVFEPSARVTHVGAHATGAESHAMVRAHHNSAKRFLGNKYRGWHLWPLRMALNAGLSVRAHLLTRPARTQSAAH